MPTAHRSPRSSCAISRSNTISDLTGHAASCSVPFCALGCWEGGHGKRRSTAEKVPKKVSAMDRCRTSFPQHAGEGAVKAANADLTVAGHTAQSRYGMDWNAAMDGRPSPSRRCAPRLVEPGAFHSAAAVCVRAAPSPYPFPPVLLSQTHRSACLGFCFGEARGSPYQRRCNAPPWLSLWSARPQIFGLVGRALR